MGDDRTRSRRAVAESPGVRRSIPGCGQRDAERRHSGSRGRGRDDRGRRSVSRSREGETGEQDDRATHQARIAPRQVVTARIRLVALKSEWTRMHG